MTNNVFPSSAQINFQVTESQKHARANLTLYLQKDENKTTLVAIHGLHACSMSVRSYQIFFVIALQMLGCKWRLRNANSGAQLLQFTFTFYCFAALFWSHMLKFNLISLHCCSEFYLVRFTLIFYISFQHLLWI